MVDRYYREHPDGAPLRRPARSASTICSPSCSLIRELLTSGEALSDIQLFWQLKNLNEIKAALQRWTRRRRAA